MSKLIDKNGNVEFEGTPSECGAFCRERNKKEDEKLKNNKPKEHGNFEKFFGTIRFKG